MGLSFTHEFVTMCGLYETKKTLLFHAIKNNLPFPKGLKDCNCVNALIKIKVMALRKKNFLAVFIIPYITLHNCRITTKTGLKYRQIKKRNMFKRSCSYANDTTKIIFYSKARVDAVLNNSYMFSVVKYKHKKAYFSKLFI